MFGKKKQPPIGTLIGGALQLGVQLLLMPADHLAGGLHQGVEGRGVQRLGVLLVAAHGPGAGQRGFGITAARHLDCPAVVVVVLDHADHAGEHGFDDIGLVHGLAHRAQG